jgi:hypothetical protein
MAHHMFHVPFMLSMAYAEYHAGQQMLSALLILFAVSNTLYRAQLDLLEKCAIFSTGGGTYNAMATSRQLGQVVRNFLLGSFNFPNVLLWMTVLIWSPKLLTFYFLYANVMTFLYYFYLFSRALVRGAKECAS